MSHKIIAMKNILLIDDENKIADAVDRYYRGNPAKYKVDRYNLDALSIDKLNGGYDSIILAPMVFGYDNAGAWDALFDANVKLPVQFMDRAKELLPHGGTITHLVSADYLRGSYMSKVYSATMAAKVSFIKSYANVLGQDGIRVNGVAVGWVDEIMTPDDYAPEVLQQIQKFTPLGRMVSAAEVVRTCIWLASDQSAYISGQIISVDGGFYNVDPVTKAEYDAV